jgi:NAD(P)-dependent dehydrogenase (short-subunit alcohol dehydrogenase family)
MSAQLDFTGRVAIVTGAGNGLGRSHALELARRGARLVVNDLGGSTRGVGASPAAADAVVAEIRAAGGEAVANYNSVATRDGGEAIVASAIQAYGQLDILINTAGIIRLERFEDLAEEDLRSLLDVHVMGSFFVTQPAYRLMRDAGYGRILFTGSGSGMFGHAWGGAYNTAKAALFGLAQAVAMEGERFGILANMLLPVARGRFGDELGTGYLEVPSFAEDLSRLDLEWFASRADPEFATALAVYLVSGANRTTKASFTSAGGRYAELTLSLCDGWYAPDGSPSAEDIAEHWHEIGGRVGRQAPRNVYDEFLGIPRPKRP